MNDLDKNLQRRIVAEGSNGERFSLLTGSETVEELREIIVHLCHACPAKNNHAHCPFRTMSGLSFHAIANLVKNLPRESCLNLFEMELKCRSQQESPCHPPKTPPGN
jgi:hypothetical protein